MTLRKGVFLVLALGLLGTTFSYAEDKPTYFPDDGTYKAAKVVWEYKPDSLYKVNTSQGFVTDIELKPGEQVTYIAAGDTVRWKVDQATVSGVTHIYIKPIRNNIETNMIINTSARSYRLYLVSDDTSIFSPIIQFSFQKEEMEAKLAKPIKLTKEEKQFQDIYTEKGPSGIRQVKKLNRAYTVKRHGKVPDDLYPSEIFDDGTRTYFKMPKTNKYDMPVLYNVDDAGKLSLVNYRMNGQYMIADKVFLRAKLVFSAKSNLEITANNAKDLYQNPDKLDYSTLSYRQKGDTSNASSDL